MCCTACRPQRPPRYHDRHGKTAPVKIQWRPALALWLILLAGCVALAPPSLPLPLPLPVPAASPASVLDASDQPPPAPREFRAAWVATVANIDWPSRPGLASAVQRDEALALLNRAQTLGLNALILQVRAAGDAIYPSTLEPWSEFRCGNATGTDCRFFQNRRFHAQSATITR